MLLYISHEGSLNDCGLIPSAQYVQDYLAFFLITMFSQLYVRVGILYLYMESTCMKNHNLTIFYKIHNKLCPPCLFNCLPPVTSDVNNYNLRNNQNCVPPRCRLSAMILISIIGSYIRSWERPDDLPRVIAILCLFASGAQRNERKENKISITSGRSPGLSQQRM